VTGEPDSAPPIDLRILTAGLSDEEIAAVTSVVRATVAAAQAADGGESAEAMNARRWRRSVGPLAATHHGVDPWSRRIS